MPSEPTSRVVPAPASDPAPLRRLLALLCGGKPGVTVGSCPVHGADRRGVARAVLGLLLLGCVIMPIAACSHANRATLYAFQDGVTLEPQLSTAVYAPRTGDSADLYFSDLDPAVLLGPGERLANATGSLVHVHIFVRPRPGRTPIDDTAVNSIIRHVVFAGDGSVGVYGGGGFALPSGLLQSRFGKRNLAGGVNDATLRLVRSTNNFTDLLGAARMDLRFDARRDDELARALGARLEAVITNLPAPASPSDDASRPPAP